MRFYKFFGFPNRMDIRYALGELFGEEFVNNLMGHMKDRPVIAYLGTIDKSGCFTDTSSFVKIESGNDLYTMLDDLMYFYDMSFGNELNTAIENNPGISTYIVIVTGHRVVKEYLKSYAEGGN